jgi:hypothetical protein
MPRLWHAAALLVGFASASAHAQTVADTGQKSPAVAGVASYVLPGLGSWYAGDVHHAQVHGGIAVGLGVAGELAGLAGDCFELSCKEEAVNVVGGLIVLSYLTNAIWSTVTAVHDAQAHNDRAQGLRSGRIEIAPTFRIAPSAGDVARWRVEMRLVRMGL